MDNGAEHSAAALVQAPLPTLPAGSPPPADAPATAYTFSPPAAEAEQDEHAVLDLDVKDDADADTQSDADMDLAPLPSAFDPDAPPFAVEPVAPGYDELAVVQPADEQAGAEPSAAVAGDDAGGDSTVVPEQLAENATAGDAPGSAPDTDAIDVDPAPVEAAAEPSAPLDDAPLSPSPLNTLSSLPTELNLEPVAAPPPSAESSAAAQRRVDEARRRAANERKRVRPRPAAEAAQDGAPPPPLGKRQSRAPQRLAAAATDEELARAHGGDDDDDELHSVSDSDGPGRPRYKRVRGLNGKLIRTATRRHKQADRQLGIDRNGDAPPEKVVPRLKTLNEQKMRDMLRGQTRERQVGTCLRPRYSRFHRCTQCVSKLAGDACRFRGYRVFPIDPGTGEIIGDPWFTSTELEGEMTPLPRTFNVELGPEHMRRIERTVAPFLLPLITAELRHSTKPGAIKRVVDAAKHRSVCDFCSSTIFAGFFFCKKCGRDYCLECERFFSDSTDDMRTSPWPLPDAARPRLHRCVLPPKPDAPSKAKTPPRAAEPEAARRGSSPLSDAPTSVPASPRPALDAGAPITQPAETSAPPALSTEASLASLPTRDHPSPTQDPSAASQPAAHQAPAEPAALPDPAAHTQSAAPAGVGRSLPFFAHVRPDLQPTTRFPVDDLKAHWLALLDLVMDAPGSLQGHLSACDMSEAHFTSVDPDLAAAVRDFSGAGQPPANDAPVPPVLDQLYTTRTHDASTVPDPAGLESHARPFIRLSNRQLANDAFDAIWARGEPIVVDHVADGFTQPWTPDTFIARFGEQACYVVDCQTDTSELSTVGAFFNQFKDPAGRTGGDRVLKLKDWPATDDFQSAYPDLYNDFCGALPVPDYTRRDGVLNLYSHFPPGPTRPDIGPKMYNAFAAKETAGGYGSTRLHMDVADAVNVMLYASPRSDGSPGCAVWDLYRAEDADAIRAFLKGRFGSDPKTNKFTDPIHSQYFYLDAELRKELWEKHQVASFRVYQYPGQAVFIPAGCAHQVCNLADCIKIALDFVSPHNVERCQQLVADFRTENFALSWKEDVLQFCNIMWYAWLNVRETRERRRVEAAERAKADQLAASQVARTTLLSHAVSSVRDEPQVPGAASDAPAEAPLPAAPGQSPRADGSPATPPPGDAPEAKRRLAQRLLDAALALPDPAYPALARMPASPPPPELPELPKAEPVVEPKREPPKPARAQDKARLRFSDAIKKKHIPGHLALGVLVSQMGGAGEGEQGAGAGAGMDDERMTLDLRAHARGKQARGKRKAARHDAAAEVGPDMLEAAGAQADDAAWDGYADMGYGLGDDGAGHGDDDGGDEDGDEALRRTLGALYNPTLAEVEAAAEGA